MTVSGPKALHAWSGEFGDRYTERNVLDADAIRGRVRTWSRIVGAMHGDLPKSALEVGTNRGLNLAALPKVLDLELWGVEPNASARAKVVADGLLPAERMLEGFGHELPLADGAVELAFTSGVLIHVDPSLLARTVKEIHRVSSKYVLAIEYFAPRHEMIPYRGENDLMFRNDFGSVYLDAFPDLQVVDYGFFWRRDTVMDDSTWWLFRKT
jgi:spore coat polysaccharide biosynthesis protein SpsF